MKKKTISIIAGIIFGLLLLTIFGNISEKGTIKDFVDDAVIVAIDGGKKVVGINDYRTYISDDDEFVIGDRVIIKRAFFNHEKVLGIYHLDD